MDSFNEKVVFHLGKFTLTLPELITILILFLFTLFMYLMFASSILPQAHSSLNCYSGPMNFYVLK